MVKSNKVVFVGVAAHNASLRLAPVCRKTDEKQNLNKKQKKFQQKNSTTIKII
jgi:hypothetical protein